MEMNRASGKTSAKKARRRVVDDAFGKDRRAAPVALSAAKGRPERRRLLGFR